MSDLFAKKLTELTGASLLQCGIQRGQLRGRTDILPQTGVTAALDLAGGDGPVEQGKQR
ncbi:MAG: hypothetical protein AAB319_07285 [Pseudomonadota bacterium]